jgi:hypothetical protein
MTPEKSPKMRLFSPIGERLYLTAQKPLPLHILSQLMGHSDSKTTEIYLQMEGEEKRQMVPDAWKG